MAAAAATGRTRKATTRAAPPPRVASLVATLVAILGPSTSEAPPGRLPWGRPPPRHPQPGRHPRLVDNGGSSTGYLSGPRQPFAWEAERGRAPSARAQPLACSSPGAWPVIFPTFRLPTAFCGAAGGRRRIECCSSARREPDFSAPPEPPKQQLSVTQDFRHPRSEAESLGAAGRFLERKSSSLAHPPPRSRQALTAQIERIGVRETCPFGPRAGRP